MGKVRPIIIKVGCLHSFLQNRDVSSKTHYVGGLHNIIMYKYSLHKQKFLEYE